VVAVNEPLDDAPEQVNGSPYEDGWLVRLKPAADADLDVLMDAGAYTGIAEANEH